MFYCNYEDEDKLAKATDKINELTFNRILAIGYENLSDFQKDLVKRACLLQCKFYSEYGTEMDNISSISVEDFSISYSNNVYAGVDKGAISCLKQTGLMCRRLI